jgi:hypothetical protein
MRSVLRCERLELRRDPSTRGRLLASMLRGCDTSERTHHQFANWDGNANHFPSPGGRKQGENAKPRWLHTLNRLTAVHDKGRLLECQAYPFE